MSSLVEAFIKPLNREVVVPDAKAFVKEMGRHPKAPIVGYTDSKPVFFPQTNIFDSRSMMAGTEHFLTFSLLPDLVELKKPEDISLPGNKIRKITLHIPLEVVLVGVFHTKQPKANSDARARTRVRLARSIANLQKYSPGRAIESPHGEHFLGLALEPRSKELGL